MQFDINTLSTHTQNAGIFRALIIPIPTQRESVYLIIFVVFYIAITLYYYTGAVVRRYKGHSAHVLSLYAHRESQKFISGGQDKRALMWDTRMSVPVQTFQSDANSIGRSISSDT